jgi:hypothetical protein
MAAAAVSPMVRAMTGGGVARKGAPMKGPDEIASSSKRIARAPSGQLRAEVFQAEAVRLFALVRNHKLEESTVIDALKEIHCCQYPCMNGIRVGEVIDKAKQGSRASPDRQPQYSQPQQAPTIPTSEALEPLTHVPGLVGDLIDWVTATASRSNRILALGAALTIVGTLIGRRVATPTRSGTHLYVVTLAPTGAGKQHALNCISRAMKAAKAEQHLGAGEFMSMSAVVNTLQRQPLSLCPMDEFGAFLKRINNPRKSSQHEAAISKILRSAWGTSFEALITPEWAGRKSEIIRTPALSIYGLSTPDEFYQSLQGEDISNGFLNRFLVLSSGVRVAETTPEIEVGVVPEKLVEALQIIYNWTDTQLGTARLNDPALDPKPEVLPWASPSAKAVYTDLARTIEHEMNTQPELEPFVARTAEIAVRLATIRAAGRSGRGAAVDEQDMEWGRDVAMASAKMVASDATAKMITDMSAGKMSTKIMDVLRRAGGRATRRDVMRALGRSVRSSREVSDVVRVLEEQGLVVVSATPNDHGPPTVWYALAPE